MTVAFILLLLTSAAQVDHRGDPPIRYRLQPTENTLERVTEPARVGLLEKLNRADQTRLDRLDRLIVPDRWDVDELYYSPLPRRVSALRRLDKALVVHQPHQVFGAYEAGELVRWGPISSGKVDAPTPSGAFHLNWRSRLRRSTVNRSWRLEWYFNFENRRGLSLHEYALPGVPASHACVRLLERDARWIYEWAEEWELDERGWEVLRRGTPLWIVGEYDFGSPPPWRDPKDPHPDIGLPRHLFRHATGESQLSRPPKDGVGALTRLSRQCREEWRPLVL